MHWPPTDKMEYEKSEYLIYPEELRYSDALYPSFLEAGLRLYFGIILHSVNFPPELS